ncbi:MAG TPA: 2-oxoacid:acceptor oxidoreductase subunit alpha [Candidatus Thermoplasmatota archaeon]|nr:2-oxoacid:acceptor oxidoreductase subunit alpha [Candidatus Thermoplasmatota archaeon]
MNKDLFTVIIGGKAGQGTNKAGSVAAHMFSEMRRDVFQMNDYPSLIRGGHNFSVVSSSVGPIRSHYLEADLVIALDRRSIEAHKNHLTKNGILVVNSDETKGDGVGIPITTEAKKYSNPLLISGLASIAVIAAAVGLSKEKLEEIIKKEYKRGVDENIAFAVSMFLQAEPMLGHRFTLKQGNQKKKSITGNEAIALGALAGGLDLYFAYPMTPSTSILHFFATHGKRFGVTAVQPENEIAVANMAIGASFAGARVMVATSGGGFCLMQEAFSLAGMVEAPVLFYLGQRPGPSTGVPTYTEQGELRYALTPGQGEFPRIVASPGSVEEAFTLTSELLGLVWRFQTPGILLTEKHLAETTMSVILDPDKTRWAEPLMHSSGEYKRYKDTTDGISPLLFPPSSSVIKWSSYEHDEQGFTSEQPEGIARMHEKRRKKLHSLIDSLKTMRTVNVYEKGEPFIFTFGSTTMSVLEALEYGNIPATVIQPIYLEPFPVWALEKYRGKRGIVIEMNSTGQLAALLRDKAGVDVTAMIQKYDGRPFTPIELAARIKEVQ